MTINMEKPYVVGMDIGGTNTVFGIVDSRGNVLATDSVKTQSFSKIEDYVEAVSSKLRPLIESFGGVEKIKGMGVGAPNGNYYNGTIEFAPNLPWKGVIPLAALFEEAIGVPTALTNDANAAAIGGFVAGTYWLLMLVGRLCSSFIADKVSSRQMMICANGAGIIFILLAVLLGKSTTVEMPVFTGTSFQMVTVPIAAMFLVLCGLCTSIMWASIFNLATEGLGKYTAQASGIFMMMVVGGGLIPLVQNFIADNGGYMTSYIVPLICMAYMLFYAVAGCKNVNKDIPVE